MIIYFSGTPGIKGGLPEDLMQKTSIMMSFEECSKQEYARQRILDLLYRRVHRRKSKKVADGC